MKLLINALTKYILGLILVGAMLFLPAWTLNYPGAWLFIGLLFIPILVLGIVLFIKAPRLLEKRLNGNEKRETQRGVAAFLGLAILGGLLISAFDFRYSITRVPAWLVIIGSVVFLIGYAFYAEVMRENAYLSRTVEVQENQKVIDTGLYGIVRHPMYLASLLVFLPIPLILGSFLGLIPMILYPVIIVIRILDEEKLLTEHLAGYSEYKKRVKYRLIPYVW